MIFSLFPFLILSFPAHLPTKLPSSLNPGKKKLFPICLSVSKSRCLIHSPVSVRPQRAPSEALQVSHSGSSSSLYLLNLKTLNHLSERNKAPRNCTSSVPCHLPASWRQLPVAQKKRQKKKISQIFQMGAVFENWSGNIRFGSYHVWGCKSSGILSLLLSFPLLSLPFCSHPQMSLWFGPQA